MRFVLDTNIIVSALLLAGSIPRQAFDKSITEGEIGKDCIVSGETDLLVLNPFREIPIITPREFLKWRI